MKRIALFFGTRPEAIKMAPVIAAVEAAADMNAVVVSTGQHREMLDPVIELFGIDVDFDLGVMTADQSLSSLTARLMRGIDDVLHEVQPDMVLVQGDTSTTFVAGLASFYRDIPVGHVEAGLRTGNLRAPFPEEANRRLTTTITSLHFPPTDVGRTNLLQEGVSPSRITVTGNTVIDALQMELNRQRSTAIRGNIEAELGRLIGSDWQGGPYVLITGHRRENFGAGFERICEAIGSLADCFPQHRFIYPVHLNPRVRTTVHARLGSRVNVNLIEPLGYSEFITLLNHCRLVLTDSGGIQEEASALGKPVLIMREVTERPEGLRAGIAKLVGTDADRIFPGVQCLLTDEGAHRRMAEAVNPYGDGEAASRIVGRIREYFRDPPPASVAVGRPASQLSDDAVDGDRPRQFSR